MFKTISIIALILSSVLNAGYSQENKQYLLLGGGNISYGYIGYESVFENRLFYSLSAGLGYRQNLWDVFANLKFGYYFFDTDLVDWRIELLFGPHYIADTESKLGLYVGVGTGVNVNAVGIDLSGALYPDGFQLQIEGGIRFDLTTQRIKVLTMTNSILVRKYVTNTVRVPIEPFIQVKSSNLVDGSTLKLAEGEILKMRGSVRNKKDLISLTANGIDVEVNKEGNFSIEMEIDRETSQLKIVAIERSKHRTELNYKIIRSTESGIAGKYSENPDFNETTNDIEDENIDLSAFKSEAKFTYPDEKEDELLGKGQFYALLITEQDYQSDEFPMIESVSEGALRLKTSLAEYRFKPINIYHLKNPNRATIVYALNRLKSLLTANDSLLIYYAGYGFLDERLQEGFWIPSDSKGWMDFNIRIPNSMIQKYIRIFPAKHILVISDAVFTGNFFQVYESINTSSVEISDVYQNISRQAMNSGAGSSSVHDYSLAKALAEGLDRNQNIYLTVRSLFKSIRNTTEKDGETGLSPRLGVILDVYDQNGDFVFIRNKSME